MRVLSKRYCIYYIDIDIAMLSLSFFMCSIYAIHTNKTYKRCHNNGAQCQQQETLTHKTVKHKKLLYLNVGWFIGCLPSFAHSLACLVVLVIGVIRFGSVKFELVLVAIYLFHLVRAHNIDIIHDDDCLYGGTFHNHAPI